MSLSPGAGAPQADRGETGRVGEPKVRALVLAAGRGERLRPLTDLTPKPLLPVAGRPMLCQTLDQLVAIGAEAVAINLHHLAAAIPQTLGPAFGGLMLHYSHEHDLLGTLGALVPLRDFLAGADVVLLVNGDSLCRWPLAHLVRQHRANRRRGILATLLLAGAAEPSRYGGGVSLGHGGEVLALRGEAPAGGEVVARRVFAGAQALDPGLLERLPPAGIAADIVSDLYQPMLANGESIASVTTRLPWHDLGTPERYLAGVLDWASRHPLAVAAHEGPAGHKDAEPARHKGAEPARHEGNKRERQNSDAPFVGERVAIAPTANVAGSVIEERTVVGSGAALIRSMVLPGAEVGNDAILTEVVVAPQTKVPAGVVFRRCLLAPPPSGQKPIAGARLEDGLWVVPFAPELASLPGGLERERPASRTARGSHDRHEEAR